MNIIDILPRAYYNVPKCPACNSRMTGRYIKSSGEDEQIIEDALKNGELVKPVKVAIPQDNCFCIDCGFEWSQEIPVSFVTSKKIAIEGIERGTFEILAARQHEKEEKEEHKKRKMEAVKHIRNMLGL